MSFHLYDTALATTRPFVPITPGFAGIYYCGPTVQSGPHLGHVRSALVFDLLARWLRSSGYSVRVVRNITDIDDKILVNSAASFEDNYSGEHAEEPWWALSTRVTRIFDRTYDALGIDAPDVEPRATGHIPEIHALITRLIDSGHAYVVEGESGGVFFDVSTDPDYGSLTRQALDAMRSGEDSVLGKRNPQDFALWKSHKSDEPEYSSWSSPWGPGRPGWHIECSAMATRYLGEHFDIHGGGLDLRFPHHENEVAQSRSVGHGFANYWMHNGLVTYHGEKMAKSVGNVVSPQDLLDAYGPLVLRYYLSTAHYRSSLDYQDGSLEEAATAVRRIESFLRRAVESGVVVGKVPPRFAAAMDDDLNVPQALAVLHETVRRGNLVLAREEDVRPVASEVLAMTDALGLTALMDLAPAEESSSVAMASLSVLVESLLQDRVSARESKDWARADTIRDQLRTAGVIVSDGSTGSIWELGSGVS